MKTKKPKTDEYNIFLNCLATTPSPFIQRVTMHVIRAAGIVHEAILKLMRVTCEYLQFGTMLPGVTTLPPGTKCELVPDITFHYGKICVAKMERNGVALSFHVGKRKMMTDKSSIRANEAQDALDAVNNMHNAGLRRAVPPRWYGIGVSLTVAVGFALYAQKDPGNIPALLIVIGVVLLVAASRDRTGVVGKAIPDKRAGMWALVAVIAVLLVLFFGGIYVRRAYDIAWVPLVTGSIAGITIFLLSESERRRHLTTADDGSG